MLLTGSIGINLFIFIELTFLFLRLNKVAIPCRHFTVGCADGFSIYNFPRGTEFGSYYCDKQISRRGRVRHSVRAVRKAVCGPRRARSDSPYPRSARRNETYASRYGTSVVSRNWLVLCLLAFLP